MRRIALYILLTGIVVAVLCNILVLSLSSGRCYDQVDQIPHSTYGILLGTGRTFEPSPYYNARVQAAIDLYQAGKIDFIFISGEDDMEGYNEVAEMALALSQVVPADRMMIDNMGVNTWTSLDNFGDVFGYSSSVTIISQKFHNQRAVYMGRQLYDGPTVAYNAQNTDNIWLVLFHALRESMARTKEVLLTPLRWL